MLSESLAALDLEASAPPSFCCPIGRELMRDPVSCSDGHSYEREHIVRWLSESRLSPVTGAPLPSPDLRPNHALRNAIEEWSAQQQPLPPPEPAEPAVPPPPELEVGAAIIYTRSEDGTVEGARVQAVHREAAGPPYYTIRLLASGDERQTEATRLRAPGDCEAERALFAGAPELQATAAQQVEASARRRAEAAAREEAVARSRQEAAEERQAQAAARQAARRAAAARHAAAQQEAERQEAEERQAQLAAMQEDDARHDAVERSRREAEAARRARRAATGQPPLWGGSGPPLLGENWDPAAAWRGGVASAERAAAEVASGLGLAYELAAEKLEGVAAGLRQAAAGAAGAGAGAGSPRRSPP